MRVGFLKAGKPPIWEAPVLNELRKNGVDAKFITGTLNDQLDYNLQVKCSNLRSVGPIDRLLNNSSFSRLMNGIFDIRTVDLSSRFLGLNSRLKSVDIVHLTDDVMTPAWQAVNAGKKTVMTVWENIPFNPMTTLKRPTTQRWNFIKDRIDHFLPVSEEAKRMLILNGIPEQKITKVHPGIDTDLFSRRPDYKVSNRINPNGKFLILEVGRVVYEKGLTFTLRALKMLKDFSNDFLYVHVGTGNPNFLRYVNKLTELLGLEENVKFLGDVPYSGMPAIYSSADAFVMASIPNMYWEEQMGFSIVEAMSCGVIPIVSDTPAMREVVPENCGILVPSGNGESIFKAVFSIINSSFDTSSFRRNCIDHVSSEYNAVKTAKTYDDIYSSLL